MYDVITIGSNTLDVFAYTDRSESICIKTLEGEECYISYPSGSKLLINELDFDTGGGGINTAVALARMGLSVGYVGKLGADDNAHKIIEELNREGVDFLGSRSELEHEKTGYSIILDSIERKRTVLAYKGVNDNLDFDQLNIGCLKAKWFYICTMMGKSFEALKRLALYARDNQIKVVFNPSSYLAEKGIEYLAPVMDNTHILVLNQEEATYLVGQGKPLDKLKKLRKTGPRTVIITDGPKPAHCLDEHNIYYVIYPQDIRIVEVTGAGDSFASSFLAGIIHGCNVEKSLKIALANSQSVLKYKGAKRKLLSFKEAEQEILKNPPQVDITGPLH